MTPEMILDYLGILVDTTKVPDLSFTANIILPEGNYVLRVKNGVLLYQKDTQDADADVTWTTKRAGLLSIVQKNAENVAALIQQEGDDSGTGVDGTGKNTAGAVFSWCPEMAESWTGSVPAGRA